MKDGTEYTLRSAVVGSHVLVQQGRNVVPTIHVVAKANKTRVELDDGSVWTRRGDRWGDASNYWSVTSARLIVDLAAVKCSVAAITAAAKLAKAQLNVADDLQTNMRLLTLEECAQIAVIMAGAKERGK